MDKTVCDAKPKIVDSLRKATGTVEWKHQMQMQIVVETEGVHKNWKMLRCD